MSKTEISYRDFAEDARPLAIYLAARRRTNVKAVGLAFGERKQWLLLRDRENTPFFKYCLNCEFRLQERCPGGSNIIGRTRVDTGIDVNYYAPAGGSASVPRQAYRCLKAFEPDSDFPSSVRTEVPVMVEVNLPPHVLISGGGYDLDGENGSFGTLAWYLVPPDLNEENYQAYGWNFQPFTLGNISKSGQICLGSIEDQLEDECPENYDDLFWLTDALMRMSFNNDYAWFTDTDLGGNRNMTLAEYARQLKGADPISYELNNKFAYSLYKDFRHTFCNRADIKAIIPAKDVESVEYLEGENGERFFRVNYYSDLDLSPMEIR